MESYNLQSLKMAKKNEILKNRQVWKMASFLRLVEVCVFLVLVSRFSSNLPVAVKNSGEYFRDISVVLISPRFMFVIGNLIVITLFAKSGQFSGKSSGGKGSNFDIYDEFVNKSQRSNSSQVPDLNKKSKIPVPEKHATQALQTKYQKQNSFPESHHSTTTKVPEIKHLNKMSFSEERSISKSTLCSVETRNYRRTQSDNLSRGSHGEYHSKSNRSSSSQIVLRRSETGKCIKSTASSSRRSVKNCYPEDKMSSEEFRSKVEAFIARQQRLRMEEEYYVQ